MTCSSVNWYQRFEHSASIVMAATLNMEAQVYLKHWYLISTELHGVTAQNNASHRNIQLEVNLSNHWPLRSRSVYGCHTCSSHGKTFLEM